MNIGLAAATAFTMWLWYQTTFQMFVGARSGDRVRIATIMLCEDHGPQYFMGKGPASQSMCESARGWSWFAVSLRLILIFRHIVIRFFEASWRI